MSLPQKFIEIYTEGCPEGHAHFCSFVNHPTPSGCDRPWAVQSSQQPLVLERFLDAITPGTVYYLDGTAHVRDNRPVIPYSHV